MPSEIKNLEQKISFKTDELKKKEEIAGFYRELTDEKSDSTGLPIIQLLTERIDHLSELHDLIQTDFNRIQPLLFSCHQEFEQACKSADNMVGDIDKMKEKYDKNNAILDVFDVNDLKLKIKNFFSEVTIGGKKITPIKEGIESKKKEVEKKDKSLVKFSIDNLSEIDVNQKQGKVLQLLTSGIRDLTSQINNAHQDLDDKTTALTTEIESLNQQKLELKFEAEKDALGGQANQEPPPEMGEDLKKKKKTLDEARVAMEAASEALITTESLVEKSENELSLLKEYESIVSLSSENSKEVKLNMESLLNLLDGLLQVLNNFKIDDLGKKVENLLKITEKAEELLNLSTGIAPDNEILTELRNIVTTHDNQIKTKTTVTEKEEDLISIFKNIKTLIDSFAIKADGMLKVLNDEFVNSKMGDLETAIKDLKIDEAEQKKLEVKLGKKIKERDDKSEELDKVTEKYNDALRVFQTADIFWD
ncbi:MAG: hypothetical protein DWQ02_22465 [Bacteroidetes bacterium]|nr:MAG: hypothetical protein DWQ02_22465 [Bacteroidota bacterium]